MSEWFDLKIGFNLLDLINVIFVVSKVGIFYRNYEISKIFLIFNNFYYNYYCIPFITSKVHSNIIYLITLSIQLFQLFRI